MNVLSQRGNFPPPTPTDNTCLIQGANQRKRYDKLQETGGGGGGGPWREEGLLRIVNLKQNSS